MNQTIITKDAGDVPIRGENGADWSIAIASRPSSACSVRSSGIPWAGPAPEARSWRAVTIP